MKTQETATILRNQVMGGAYYRMDLRAPQIATGVQPGQFVHLRVPGFAHRVLRRPFSVCDVDLEAGVLTLVYKLVGEGTTHMSGLDPGVLASLMGPLGVGYTLPERGRTPVIVAGGYGCAATYLLVKRSPVPCICLLGGRTRDDLLLLSEFSELGADVRLATDDGSAGHCGFVTELLEEALGVLGPDAAVYACGPNAMLRRTSEIVSERGLDAEISLDHAMCCGVGACFACVVKIKGDAVGAWDYVRTCTEGPVFKASRTVWD